VQVDIELRLEQKRVYEWLDQELNLPVFAEAYKGAVILLQLKSAGYISFIAHAGRDLMNTLPSTVQQIQSKRVQYQQHVDSLQKCWKDEWQSNDELFSKGVTQGHFIPIPICKKISNLINEHKSARTRSSEADGLFFSTFLDYSDKNKIPNNFLSEWKSAKKWFLAHAHLRPKPFEQKVVNDLVTHFTCLDGYLYIAASSQHERLKVLNEILDTTNQ